MPPKRTMRIAQQLYEGMTLGRGKNSETVGLITYMRSDSVRLSHDAVNDCRDYIAKKFGKGSVPEKPNFFKTKKQNVQDAHEAIRPTRLDLPPEEVSKYLTDPQRRLYKLIWDRFVASQMMPAVFDQTGVEIEAKSASHVYGLRASGSVLKVAGWRAVYGATTELAGEEPSPDDRTDDDDSLPELKEGEALDVVIPPGVQGQHKKTEPPPLFTEATLVKRLEEEGIGRPSTDAEKPVYWTLIAMPVESSKATMGPLLRRGTISTTGGMPPPGGTGTTLLGTPSSKFTRNSTGTGTIGSCSPR
jgi:DNA topoisomerase-1